MNESNVWDERFLQLAEHIAQWGVAPDAPCARLNGAVLVGADNRILSYAWGDNAIRDTLATAPRRESVETTLYCVVPPHLEIAIGIVRAGVDEICCRPESDPTRIPSQRAARDLFIDAGLAYWEMPKCNQMFGDTIGPVPAAPRVVWLSKFTSTMFLRAPNSGTPVPGRLAELTTDPRKAMQFPTREAVLRDAELRGLLCVPVEHVEC